MKKFGISCIMANRRKVNKVNSDDIRLFPTRTKATKKIDSKEETMINKNTYPKTISLRNGSEVTIRLLKPTDGERLSEFLMSIPSKERVHFRDDVTDSAVVSRWVEDINLKKVVPLVAIQDNIIVSQWTLHVHEYGWTRHHGEIRGIVLPEIRKQGLATAMIYELLTFASELDIERLVISLVRTQQGLLRSYQEVGFRIEAVLKDWVKDFNGDYHDLYLLTMELEPAWRKMEEMILDMGTHGG